MLDMPYPKSEYDNINAEVTYDGQELYKTTTLIGIIDSGALVIGLSPERYAKYIDVLKSNGVPILTPGRESQQDLYSIPQEAMTKLKSVSFKLFGEDKSISFNFNFRPEDQVLPPSIAKKLGCVKEGHLGLVIQPGPRQFDFSLGYPFCKSLHVCDRILYSCAEYRKDKGRSVTVDRRRKCIGIADTIHTDDISREISSLMFAVKK